MSILLGREGDQTGSDAILWIQTLGISYSPSPVPHDGKFYALTDNGMISCFNANAIEFGFAARKNLCGRDREWRSKDSAILCR